MALKLEQEIRDSFKVRHLKQVAMGGYAERLAYHRITLVEQGRGQLLVDEVTYAIPAHSVFLIAKGQVCNFSDDNECTGLMISFGDCFWERSPSSASNCKGVLFNNARENQQLLLSAEQFPELKALLDNLYQEYVLPAYLNKQDALAAYLKIIMIKLANINTANLPEYEAYDRQVYRKFTELVSAQYKSLHDVEAYAQQMHLTARRLTELCKRCSGKGAKELINGQLLSEAKRLLQFSSFPVKEIAYELNFSTPEQFTHFFRKSTTRSPREYRCSYVNMDR